MQVRSTRRQVVTGLAGLSLASLLSDPVRVAKAAAALKDVVIQTSQGKQVTASLAMPATVPAGGVVLIHEWWGLNDQIKAVAAELAEIGFVALAIDLYGGQSASDPAGAEKLMKAVNPAEASDTMKAWVDWLRTNKDCTGKVATIGWCFGGGMSLQAALDSPLDATIIYYGNVARSPEELKAIKGPVLGHFATQDEWINPDMVAGFEQAMEQAGKDLEVHQYDANHAFANPTGDNYDAEDARLAWDRTVEFLRKTIG